MARTFSGIWKTTIGGKNVNRRIKKYLDEIDKTERKITELQAYLKGIRSALKQEEDNEIIKSIRTAVHDRFGIEIMPEVKYVG